MWLNDVKCTLEQVFSPVYEEILNLGDNPKLWNQIFLSCLEKLFRKIICNPYHTDTNDNGRVNVFFNNSTMLYIASCYAMPVEFSSKVSHRTILLHTHTHPQHRDLHRVSFSSNHVRIILHDSINTGCLLLDGEKKNCIPMSKIK